MITDVLWVEVKNEVYKDEWENGQNTEAQILCNGISQTYKAFEWVGLSDKNIWFVRNHERYKLSMSAKLLFYMQINSMGVNKIIICSGWGRAVICPVIKIKRRKDNVITKQSHMQ